MDAQLDQLAEECAEFIIALNHLRRGRIKKEKLLEEIADVSVMAQEMKVYFYEQIEVIEKRKIRRLNRKIDCEINAGIKAGGLNE